MPCCGLRCSCGSVQAVAFRVVDQNVSIVMALVLSTQRNLSYAGFGEALILEYRVYRQAVEATQNRHQIPALA